MLELSKKAMEIMPSLTLKITAMSKRMKDDGLDVIGFGAGEPDFDTPQFIKEAAIDSIKKGYTKYTPAVGILDLRQEACNRYQRKYGLSYPPEQVIVSNGAKHSLFNVFQAILNPRDEVIIISPYWLTYPELIKMADGVPVIVETKEEAGFEPAMEALLAAVTEKTKAIVVNSPSNPSGNVYSKATLENIAALAKEKDFLIISDEIYDELIYGAETCSIASISEDAKKRTIIINGVSKAYAMTGWRIGYAIAPVRIAKVMSAYQSNATSNPCSIAQYASVAALRDGDKEAGSMMEVFKKRSLLMYQLVNDIPLLSAIKPAGAFYSFVNISETIGKCHSGRKITGSLDFAELLLKEKMVAVVPGIAFGKDEFVRLSYACAEQTITKGLKRITQFCGELI